LRPRRQRLQASADHTGVVAELGGFDLTLIPGRQRRRAAEFCVCRPAEASACKRSA